MYINTPHTSSRTHTLPSPSLTPLINIIFLNPHILAGNMSRPGDWNCRSCQHLNFQRRDSCQLCGEPKTADVGGRTTVGGSSYGHGYGGGADVRPGDWYCTDRGCGTHNFASRTCCFKCGAFKDSDASGGFEGDLSRRRGFPGGSGLSGWKSGDWICTRLGCNEHNFANRMECYRCNAPRDFSSG